MENFSALFGGAEPPPATAAAALGFGPAKAAGAGAAPPPAAAVPPPGEDAAHKAAAGPFYLLRELPGAGRAGPQGGGGPRCDGWRAGPMRRKGAGGRRGVTARGASGRVRPGR